MFGWTDTHTESEKQRKTETDIERGGQTVEEAERHAYAHTRSGRHADGILD